MRRTRPKVRHKGASSIVSSNIRAEMGRRGLSQRHVAEWLNVDQPVISNRLTGRVPFDIEELAVIADHLGLSLVDLVTPPTYAGGRAPIAQLAELRTFNPSSASREADQSALDTLIATGHGRFFSPSSSAWR